MKKTKEILFVVIIPGLIWTFIVLLLQLGFPTVVGAWTILLINYWRKQEVVMSGWEVFLWFLALVVLVTLIPVGIGSVAVDDLGLSDNWGVAISTLTAFIGVAIWLFLAFRRVKAAISEAKKGGK